MIKSKPMRLFKKSLTIKSMQLVKQQWMAVLMNSTHEDKSSMNHLKIISFKSVDVIVHASFDVLFIDITYSKS